MENSCGTCIACCYALAFNAEEGLKKKAGDMCPNCTGTGCGIYETRFKLCRSFLCAWRKLPQLGDDWRPDKSGVMLIEVTGEQIPEGYRDAGIGMEFLLLKMTAQSPGRDFPSMSPPWCRSGWRCSWG